MVAWQIVPAGLDPVPVSAPPWLLELVLIPLMLLFWAAAGAEAKVSTNTINKTFIFIVKTLNMGVGSMYIKILNSDCNMLNNPYHIWGLKGQCSITALQLAVNSVITHGGAAYTGLETYSL